MKKTLSLLALLISLFAFQSPATAQQRTPVSSVISNAGKNINFPVVVNVPTTSVAGPVDNQQIPASGWVLTFYTPPGISAVSMELQSAEAGATTTTPGTFGPFAGTIDATFCSNPCLLTGTHEIHGTGPYPWVQAKLISATGSGTITGILTGYPTNNTPVNVTVTGGGGCPGTIGTPCVVTGNKTNNNAAPGATNVGVIPALANAAPPSWTEGDLVLESVDLGGRQRVLSTIAGNGAVLSGQQSVTGSAVALATNAAKAACVKALVSNVINVFVGPSAITTSTGYLLAPGESACLPVTNTNLLFVIASTTGASVSWLGSN